MRQFLCCFFIVILGWGIGLAQVNHDKKDIFLVLDNSGSMRTNDPDFLTREVVRNFLSGIDTQSRLGMVIFAENAELAHPLTPVTGGPAGEDFFKSLAKVDYQGQWTNIPAAIERALYELKTNGRKDAEKIIIFLTDGIVDTGNRDLDLEKTRWLREELTEDCKKSGIRIFAIAFTENADFSLIQSLALKTDGQYFRAFKAGDIQAVFTKIKEAFQTLETPESAEAGKQPAPAPAPVSPREESAAPEEPEEKEELPITLILAIMGGVIIPMLGVGLLVRRKRKGNRATGKLAADPGLPPAQLLDEQQVISHKPIEIHKAFITIGRDPNTDLTIPKGTVSALHATIKYMNHAYYLEDQRSSNYTRLNSRKLAPNQPVALKSGDRITFDIYHFQFVLTQSIPAGGTVLKREASRETRDTAFKGAEPWESPSPPKTGTKNKPPEPPNKSPEPSVTPPPAGHSEPAEKPTMVKPKPAAQNEPPEQKTLAKPKREPQPQPTPAKDKTMVKPGFCPHHPDRKAVTLCSVCKKPFCSLCILKIHGRDVCVDCAPRNK